MAIEATGVENVMEEVAHFWQLRKFQFIEEATDFWMDAVAPKECFGDEDPEHECCAYDRPCHMYDLQRAIEGGREYKGFHFEYMVPPSVSGER